MQEEAGSEAEAGTEGKLVMAALDDTMDAWEFLLAFVVRALADGLAAAADE